MQLEEAKYLEYQNHERIKHSEHSQAVLQQIRQKIEDLRLSNDILESKNLSQLEQFGQRVRTAQSNTDDRRAIEQKEAEEMSLCSYYLPYFFC
jgi:cellulose biosynthesis protein BcsQ